MKFGPVPLSNALGAVLAHRYAVGTAQLRKGHVLTSGDIARLREAGNDTVIVALLADDDVDEDAAAMMLAESMRLEGINAGIAATGRVNLHAVHRGLFVVDADAVHAFNRMDPAITVATLASHVPVEAGQMVATVKIIPFAVAKATVRRVVDLALGLTVAPFQPRRVTLIQTVLPGLKASVRAKTVRVTRERLEGLGCALDAHCEVGHDAKTLADVIVESDTDMVIVFGASAVSDADDVIPGAIRLAGGDVERVGMPVDPGNLLVLGRRGSQVIIGAPGCARSPKENGFDWVLRRIVAGLVPSSDDIARMGVGGLLGEIPTRPRPRQVADGR